MIPPTPRATGVARPLAIVLAGLGAALAIFVLASVHAHFGWAVLIPPFGSSCALIFAHPESPFARPFNVIGGHLISSALGLLTLATCGNGPAAMGIGVGLAIAGMMATQTMHPPAGGDPLIVIATAAPVTFLVTPILVGTVAIVLIGVVYRSFSAKAAHFAAGRPEME